MIKKVLGLLLLVSAMAASAWAQPGTVNGRVPEVDPGFLGASVALLLGGSLLFGHAKKKKK